MSQKVANICCIFFLKMVHIVHKFLVSELQTHSNQRPIQNL